MGVGGYGATGTSERRDGDFRAQCESAWEESGEKQSESRGLCQGFNEKVPIRGGREKKKKKKKKKVKALHDEVTQLAISWETSNSFGSGKNTHPRAQFVSLERKEKSTT